LVDENVNILDYGREIPNVDISSSTDLEPSNFMATSTPTDAPKIAKSGGKRPDSKAAAGKRSDSKAADGKESGSPRPEAKKPHNIVLRLLGPGLVTGAADDDPSGIATYSQAGAQFGYGLLWTVFLTTPFMIVIQLISAQIGRVTGKGLAANVMELAPRWLVLSLVFILVVANTFNIAADIAAMGEALSLVIGGLNHEHALIFASASTLLQVFVPYRRYAPVLKFLTLTLFAYVATALTVNIPWSKALLAAVWPTPTINTDYFMMVVAVLGTTISPYLFFWQASQEVEEMNQGKIDRPLRELTRGGGTEMDRMKIDTTVGMLFSNAIAFSIILTTATVLNAHGVTNINSATEAAEALRPLAGNFTFFLFALGIIGTGMLAIPVLAGSAAYGVSEAFGWHATLEAKAPEAVGFYTIIAAATAIGFGLGFTGIDAIHMLVWSAVLNGIVAVPIMAMMMVIVANTKLMGRFKAKRGLIIWGWIGTGLMGLAVVALILSFFIG
jgi:NRAMP (natural resistance-associated macrophage protein)-like metal ion transporter